MNEQPLIIDNTTTADTTQAQAVILQPPPKQGPGNPGPIVDCPPSVPEPSTAILIGVGAVVAIIFRRSLR